MSTFFDDLEHDLVAAAARQAGLAPVRQRRRRGRWPGLLMATLLCVGAGAATAGGTLYVLRGSVIPAPAAKDVPPEQLPVAGSSHLTGVRAADPEAGSPAWTLRLARSRTGFLCSTVGQLIDGRFGLVGMDGRFRALPERAVDSCSQTRSNAASVVGVRVFDARQRTDVRSLVYGVAGDQVRAVELLTAAQTRRLPIRNGGAFLAAVRGYPEDAGVQLTLRFADGHTERHPLGTSPWVVADPGGLGAWHTSVGVSGSAPGEPQDDRTCVNFSPARPQRDPPISPPACGRDHGPLRHPEGWWFKAARLRPGGAADSTAFFAGRWGDHPARTAVWGLANEDVKTLELLRPGVPPQRLRPAPNRAFLAMFKADVDPRTLRVRATFTDGSIETYAHRAHLVREPSP